MCSHEFFLKHALAERGSRARGSDVIAKVFKGRIAWRLKNEEKNFEFNVGSEGKPMKLLCHKRGDARAIGKASNESSGGIEDSLDRRWSNFIEANETSKRARSSIATLKNLKNLDVPIKNPRKPKVKCLDL